MDLTILTMVSISSRTANSFLPCASLPPVQRFGQGRPIKDRRAVCAAANGGGDRLYAVFAHGGAGNVEDFLMRQDHFFHVGVCVLQCDLDEL